MEFSKLFIALFIFQVKFPCNMSTQAAPANSNLFREYIGAEFNNVKFSDVPIHSSVEFHFIISFAIDYDTSGSPSPTNGKFNVFWDSDNLGPSQVSSIKSNHSNVKVALSLGGDSVGDGSAYFNPSSVDSWVSNAVSSLTDIIQQYNLDGVDVDYEHFNADPDTFADFISDGSRGLTPENGFFTACSRLKSRNKLIGIFIWSADDPKKNGFRYEKQSQALLAISH
ncbi:Chitinase 2 [Hibiscus syriacus]|uniref:Chitinase 2 n=1 Tax=Hibiscus syriacus TaxID=106335 RepID=A0A6A2YMD2_HIBSY|nr:Chitinase 2 [Hibiscus syriacus]